MHFIVLGDAEHDVHLLLAVELGGVGVLLAVGDADVEVGVVGLVLLLVLGLLGLLLGPDALLGAAEAVVLDVVGLLVDGLVAVLLLALHVVLGNGEPSFPVPICCTRRTGSSPCRRRRR